MFLPSIPLTFWNAGLDACNLGGAEAGGSTLVLGTGEVRTLLTISVIN